MTLSRRVARPMLASIFIAGGLDAFRNPEGKVKSAEAVVQPLSDAVPGFPSDTEKVVKLNGAVQVGAGALLALGKFRRLSALALIGSIVPTTYAGHRFWQEPDDATKAQQRIHFLKNLGLLGGLILALVDTEGAPSLSWRAKRRAHRLGDTVGSVVVATGALTHHGDGSAKAHRASDAVSAKAHSAGGKASDAKGRAVKQAAGAAKRANKAAMKGPGTVAKGAHDVSANVVRLADAGNRAAKGAHDVAQHRGHEAAVAAGKLSETGGRAARKANKLAVQQAHEAQQRAIRLTKSGGRAAKRANKLALNAAKSTAGAAKTTADLAKSAAQVAKATAGEAAHTVSTGADRAGDVLSKVHDQLPVG